MYKQFQTIQAMKKIIPGDMIDSDGDAEEASLRGEIDV